MKRVLALLCAFIVTLVMMPPAQAHASAATSTRKLAWTYVSRADPKSSHWNSARAISTAAPATPASSSG
ncbi:hypothetical protein [Nonomuraea zeae]|uniref:Uncharacterized protein n=1 Tax=Nonomuraea zeae TaxID=1642303 RepID=A0A5S4GN35_9ACTN|nr:hypothetical protein [Nonomuraea zeae]TMR34209.1 hypothetical protein ETD85_17350 [Nonomuraea zeae]